MGQSFLEELLANVTNEQALAEGVDRLSEANKHAYQQAIEDLHKNQSQIYEADEPELTSPDSKLDMLLRHIS